MSEAQSPQPAPSTNGQSIAAAQEQLEQAESQQVESTFQINIKLPHAPYTSQTIVSTQDQIQDIRQSIIDLPHTFQYTCFHLEKDGKRVPDFVDINDMPEVTPDVELTLVEDPYTEKDARIHLLRIRELIGASGDHSDAVSGLSAGISLHDQVSRTAEQLALKNGEANGKNQTHPLSDFDYDAAPNLQTLLPVTGEAAPKTIKSISLSPWNPPPQSLRMKGHLLYLQLTTNEGEQYQITAHVTGFYVNKNSNTKFDPSPRQAPKASHAHSLLNLIATLSPSFEMSFKQLQEFNGRKDLLASFQLSNALPASPWLLPPTSATNTDHVTDICRTQESYLVAGVDNGETLRDWNEEFQTTRELPRESVQDRVFRERVTSKLFADYAEAAVNGAVLIARGEVAPLNPTEPTDAQIFVYNNVFYSFGADGVGTFANEGGDEAARAATGKDVVGVKTVNQVDIPGLATPGTVIVDYLGKRIVCQSIVPGIFKQREPGEHQIDYGGVEGRDVVADNDVFAPLFKKLSEVLRVKAHPVWDKDGKRHDLEASIETKGLLGTDGRKYILDLYRITPVDITWLETNWKQVDGEEQRSSDAYPHRMTVLRPELVEAYWRTKLREYVRTELAKTAGKKAEENPADGESTDKATEGSEIAEKPKDQSASTEQERVDLSGFQFTLNPDAFSGQKPETEDEKEQWIKDEADVRAAADYLHNDVMPKFASDLLDGEVGFPMDGASLTTLMHKRGINVRYLGKIAELAQGSEPRKEILRRLTEQEMISRAFKHLLNAGLKQLPFAFANSCIAHYLNCLLGAKHNKSPRAAIDEDLKALYQVENLDFVSLTPEKLQKQLQVEVLKRYKYTLNDDWSTNIKIIPMLREIASKTGLQLTAKDYSFTASLTNGHSTTTNGHLAPTTNGHATSNSSKKNKKRNADHSPNRASETATETLPGHTFQPEDILNIVPIIKDAAPRSALAEEALEAGRISVAQQQKELGQELLLESLSLHEQIYGVIHAEVARVYYSLSTLFYSLDDKAIASELARKAVIVSERTLGVDHNETILAYFNLGLFEHAAGNTRLALQYIRHALEVWKVIFGGGAYHPDSITTLNNVAVMLQNLKLYKDSRIWFEKSLEVCQQISGRQSSNTATLLFQLAQAMALDQDSKGAVKCMREAYNVFNNVLGPNDRNTKEAETWLEQLTQNAVSIAKHAKDVQARRMRRLNVAPGVAGFGTRPQVLAGQSEGDVVGGRGVSVESGVGAGVSGVGGVGGVGGVDERSVEELIKYIEGGERKSGGSKKKSAVNPKRKGAKA